MTGRTGKSEMKVPGGKLIRVECTIEKGALTRTVITGDFFVHPEDGIQALEEELTSLPAEPEVIRNHVLSFFRGGYAIVGATPEDFAKAIMAAVSHAS